MTLDDVLNEFVAENDRPTARNLEEWTGRYPQYQKELVDFAAAWAEQLVLLPAPELGTDVEKALIDRTMSHMLNVAFKRDEQIQSQVENDTEIDSLTRQAQHAGMNAQEFAKSCGLDLLLVSKLNSRQIAPQTIPARLIARIASLLGRAGSAVTDYLAQPPIPVAGKAFLSHEKPTRMEQQSFSDAVRSSSLSEDDKALWFDEKGD